MSNRQSNRAFGLTIAAFMAVIWGVGYLWSGSWLSWPPVVALVFVSVAMILPSVLLPLNRLWGLGLGAIGHMNNRIILGLFFFAVITPIGVFIRLVGKDPMHRQPTSKLNSYFVSVGRQANADTYRDMF